VDLKAIAQSKRAAPEVQLALNRGEKYCTYNGAMLYALASALPLGFVVVRRYRFPLGCCREISDWVFFVRWIRA